MKYYKFFIFLVSLTVSSSAFTDPGVTDNEIVLGAHTTESGPLAVYAQGVKSLSAYFDAVNKKGGVNGRKIRWIHRDSQSLAPKSIEAIRELVERDNIFATVACNGPSHIAVYKYLSEHGVPDILFYDGASAYSDKSLKFTFPFYSPWETEGKTVADYLIKTNKGKKFCFVKSKDTVGEEYVKGGLSSIETFNHNASASDKVVLGPIIGVERMANQADSEILNLKQEKCDVVMTSAYGNLTPNFINYAFSQDFKPHWAIIAFNANAKFISLIKSGAADGVMSFTNFARDKSLVLDKKGWAEYEQMMKKNDIPISATSGVAYMVGEVFTEILKRAGRDLTRASLVKAAESFHNWNCSLCINPINSSASNHYLFKEGRLITIKNSEWHFID